MVSGASLTCGLMAAFRKPDVRLQGKYQAALRLIFEFVHCGQIETPAIMIDMNAVAQKWKK